MSIPPLVCSTPPPPDQCDDDKDPDDFDLHYILSQDDDDDDTYEYADFSNYNNFQPSTSASQNPASFPKHVEINKNDNIIKNEDNLNCTNLNVGTNSTIECKLKDEEDNNIEDLNLTVDEETLERTEVTDSQNSGLENKNSNNECLDKQIHLSDNIDEQNINTKIITSSKYALEPKSKIDIDTPSEYVEEIAKHKPGNPQTDISDLQVDIGKSSDLQVKICAQNDLEVDLDEPSDFQVDIVEPNDLQVDIVETNTVSGSIISLHNFNVETVIKESEEPKEEISKNPDDDFGDFDDFQFASNIKPTTIVGNCDNPWEKSKDSNDIDLSDFKANFSETENNLTPEVTFDNSNDQFQNPDKIDEFEGDDFGDFDDFKSSANELVGTVVREEIFSDEQVPVLNLQSSENESQIIESINKVINSIFEHEISVPEIQFEGKLQSSLGETWGHLLETDVRQPYVVNWNNSMGQKTLLKALCIDSRNILFGPKWNYNMPKYAANLSTAPLQPQKQSTSSNMSQTENLSVEKTVTQTTDTWSDPFTSSGQESCTNEKGNDNAVIETGPTDLEVFEAAASSKSDKIYSNTLNHQTLRQINLPDTHIFTPTNSETPRSKTIHYDSSPTAVISKTIDDKHLPESLDPEPSSSSVIDSLGNESEDWEFQDFKGTSETLPQHTLNFPISAGSTSKTSQQLQNPSSTYEIQVLQPIKVEPIIPTLNWPDPGQIKETFEDFSDFISNSTWANEKQDSGNSSNMQHENNVGKSNFSYKTRIKEDTTINKQPTTSDVGNADDEFDSFQSALPGKSSEHHFNFVKDMASVSGIVTPQILPKTIEKFDNVFSKKHNFKSDLANVKPNLNSLLPTNVNLTNSKKEIPNENLTPGIIQNSIMQPTLANISSTSHSQQKSAQILQPLSLESYSQINWPNPGIDLQDLSRFNPVETLQSLKSDLSVNSHTKSASPVHSQKNVTNPMPDDDVWGEFVSSKPKQQHVPPKKLQTFVDDDEWTDFVSSPSVKPQNGLNTISLNVHTNKSNQNNFVKKNNQVPIDIPTLNYITPKATTHKSYNDRHFQNL